MKNILCEYITNVKTMLKAQPEVFMMLVQEFRVLWSLLVEWKDASFQVIKFSVNGLFMVLVYVIATLLCLTPLNIPIKWWLNRKLKDV